MKEPGPNSSYLISLNLIEVRIVMVYGVNILTSPHNHSELFSMDTCILIPIDFVWICDCTVRPQSNFKF